MQFIGLSLVYNLDKKTTAKMTEELNARHEAAAKEKTDFHPFVLQKRLSCKAALCYSKVINYGIF